MELPKFFASQERYLRGAKTVVKDFAEQYAKDLKTEIPKSSVMQKTGIKQVDSKIESVVRETGSGVTIETTLSGNYAKVVKFPEFNDSLPEKIKPERIGDNLYKRFKENTRQ